MTTTGRFSGIDIVSVLGPEEQVEIQSDPDLYAGPAVDGTFLVAAGDSGTQAGLNTRVRCAIDGIDIEISILDTDWRDEELRDLRIRTPAGDIVGIHQSEFFRLGQRDGRTTWRKCAAADWYTPRLSRLSAHQLEARPGHGSGADRLIAMLDLMGDADLLAPLFRRLLKRLITESPRDGKWMRRKPPGKDIPRPRLRGIVVGSAVGAVGSTVLVFAPYFLRQAAETLGVDLELYAFVLGPSSFQGPSQGVHPHVMENFASTLSDLEELNHSGLEWTLMSGTRLSIPKAPYTRIFVLDNAEEVEGFYDQADSQAHLKPPPDSVRNRFFQRVGSTIYSAAISSNALARFEADTADIDIAPWGTMRSVTGDLASETLRSLIASRKAANRLSTVHTSRNPNHGVQSA